MYMYYVYAVCCYTAYDNVYLFVCLFVCVFVWIIVVSLLHVCWCVCVYVHKARVCVCICGHNKLIAWQTHLKCYYCSTH